MTQIIKAIRSGHPPTLISAFLYFDVSFMIWVLMGALGVSISRDLQLTIAQKGIVVAVPLLGASIFRVLIGVLVDRFGPKRVGIFSLLTLILPLLYGWLIASSFVQMILVGFLLGIAGSSFAVALPLASRAYPSEHQGMAMGIAGAGNSGSVIAVLVAPFLAEQYGWHAVFGLALLPLLITLFVFILMAREAELFPFPKPFYVYRDLLKEKELWWFNLYYGVTFGGFVGLASFLAIFLNDQYHVSPTVAGGLTAACILAGSFFRPIGGYFSDRIGGARLLVALYFMMTVLFGSIALLPSLRVAVPLFFVAMLILGMGNGAIFQWVPQRFGDEIGLVTGLVGAAGGLGGFFLPTLLSQTKQMTHSYGSGFLLLSMITFLCALSLVIKIKKMPAHVATSGLSHDAQGRIRMEVLFGG